MPRRRRTCGLLSTVVLASLGPGCPQSGTRSGRSEPVDAQRATPPSEEPTGPDTKEEAPVSALGEAREAVTMHMGKHFSRLLDVRDALVAGRLEQARPHARWIAEHRPEAMPADWLPFIVEMRDAARTVADAETLERAAMGTGVLARSCGACHLALDADLRWVQSEVPPEGEDAASKMRKHKWAADRLWEGVTFPSEEAWRHGVDAFVDLPECSPDPTQEIDRSAVDRLREQVSALQDDARQATDLDARASIYGRMLGTCGTCHLSGC